MLWIYERIIVKIHEQYVVCIKESSCLVSFVFQMCCTSSAIFLFSLFLPIVWLFYNKIVICNEQKSKDSSVVFKCLMSLYKIKYKW